MMQLFRAALSIFTNFTIRIGQTAAVSTFLLLMTALQQELNGPDHEETQGRRGNLGRFLLDQGKLDEAESLYRQNLVVQEAQLGEMHPKTLPTVYGLATILEKKGSMEKAGQWKIWFCCLKSVGCHLHECQRRVAEFLVNWLRCLHVFFRICLTLHSCHFMVFHLFKS